MPHVPYSTRPDWADVVPIPQADCENPVVAIQYSSEFTDTMNYLRAMMEKDERSARALQLTEHVIALNAANYTVWAYRRAIVDALGRKASDELEWTTALARDNPKNYQIWQHRRWCVERAEDGRAELAFLADFLTDEDLEDAKNYHAWAQRQWTLRTFALWHGEEAFIDQLLAQDVRNNSAWNQRFFVAENTTDMGLAARTAELEWALGHTKCAPNNASAWGFIRAMLGEHPLSAVPSLDAAVAEYSSRNSPVAGAVELRATCLALQGDKASKAEAAKLFLSLASSLDAIRAPYWRHCAESIG